MTFKSIWKSAKFSLLVSSAGLAWQTPATAAELDATAGLIQAPTASARAPEKDQGQRLANLGYRLAKANADKCSNPQKMTGLTIHNMGAYDLSEREELARRYRMGQGFGVAKLVPGSAAQRAGIEVDDVIMTLNGRDLTQFMQKSINRRASYTRTEQFLDLLDTEFARGPANLGILRRGKQISVELEGERGCGGRFTVLSRSALNAWADGRYVAVTRRLMEFTPDDDELAFVVAHEMAHNILEHKKKLKGTSMLLAEFGLGAHKVKATEIEADKLTVSILANAGTDLEGPQAILNRLSGHVWMNLALNHPGISRRIEIVSKMRAQLALAREHAPPAIANKPDLATVAADLLIEDLTVRIPTLAIQSVDASWIVAIDETQPTNVAVNRILPSSKFGPPQ